MRRNAVSIVSVCLLLAAMCQAAERLVLLDGTAVQDTVTAIDAQGAVRCQGRPQPLDLQGLRRIERAAAGSPAPAPCDVYLSSGGILRAQSVAFDSQLFTLKWADADSLTLPLALVRAVRLNALPGAVPPAFEASIAEDETRLDELFAISEATVQAVRGGRRSGSVPTGSPWSPESPR